MKSQTFEKQDGFIALISIVLIFSALIILVSLVSISGFYARFNVLDYENKKISMGLAEACGETALVNLAKDPTGYGLTISSAGQQITVDTGKTCRVCSVSTTSPYTILTRASYKNAYTNLSVNGTLGVSNFNVTSWDEFSNYTGSCTLP